jgi:hypothetical protein
MDFSVRLEDMGRLLEMAYRFDLNALFEEKGRLLVCIARGRSRGHTTRLLPAAPAFALITTLTHWRLDTRKGEIRLSMPCTTTGWREFFSNCIIIDLDFTLNQEAKRATPFIHRLTFTNSHSKCWGMIDIVRETYSDYWC